MTEQYLPTTDIFSNDWYKECIWIEITPKKISTVSWQKTTTIQTDPVEATTYSILAPRDFQETWNHSWKPIENISSYVSEKIAVIAGTLTQGTSVYKVDSPSLYESSTRAAITFIFNLVYTGKNKLGIYKEVMEPVKNFIKWSTPNIANVIAAQNIELPYVFSIKTKLGDGRTVDMINIRNAAITSVQPTYYGPYIDGYPTKVELSLSFEDIELIDRDRNITIGGP